MAMQRIEHVQLAMPAGEEDAARRFDAQALGMTEVPKPEEPLNVAAVGLRMATCGCISVFRTIFVPPRRHIRHSWWTICKLLRSGCVVQDFPAR